MVNASGSGAGASFSGSATFHAPAFSMPVVVGAPYSGEETTEMVQTLADGTRITSTAPGRKVWRDSQGRTRTERSLFGRGNIPTENQVMLVEISGPVAGVQYVLDTQNKVAHRLSMAAADNRPRLRQAPAQPPPAAVGYTAGIVSPPMGGGGGSVEMRAAAAAGAPGIARPEFKSEPLASRTIGGILAEGHRVTTTYATGSVGNDRPFSVTSETWTSPDLKMPILTVTSDPRSGERTFRIANLSRNEPDSSLFLPPADYSVVDEKDTSPSSTRGSSGAPGPRQPERVLVPREMESGRSLLASI